MIDGDEVLALLDELEPYPAEWPDDVLKAADSHQTVFRARAALAEEHGLTKLDLLALEVTARTTPTTPGRN